MEPIRKLAFSQVAGAENDASSDEFHSAEVPEKIAALPGKAPAVYLYLLVPAHRTHSAAQIATALRCSDRTVFRALKALTDAGQMLSLDRREGRSTIASHRRVRAPFSAASGCQTPMTPASELKYLADQDLSDLGIFSGDPDLKAADPDLQGLSRAHVCDAPSAAINFDTESWPTEEWPEPIAAPGVPRDDEGGSALRHPRGHWGDFRVKARSPSTRPPASTPQTPTGRASTGVQAPSVDPCEDDRASALGSAPGNGPGLGAGASRGQDGQAPGGASGASSSPPSGRSPARGTLKLAARPEREDDRPAPAPRQLAATADASWSRVLGQLPPGLHEAVLKLPRGADALPYLATVPEADRVPLVELLIERCPKTNAGGYARLLYRSEDWAREAEGRRTRALLAAQSRSRVAGMTDEKLAGEAARLTTSIGRARDDVAQVEELREEIAIVRAEQERRGLLPKPDVPAPKPRAAPAPPPPPKSLDESFAMIGDPELAERIRKAMADYPHAQ